MTVYVDPLWISCGVYACRMVADREDELHAMAERIGVDRSFFKGAHYDICPDGRDAAVDAGAREITRRRAAQIRSALRVELAYQALVGAQ